MRSTNRLKIGIVCLGIFLGLGTAEILLRVTPSRFRMNVQRNHYMVVRHLMQTDFCARDTDPLLGWHNIPGKQGLFENREFRTHLRFNRYGMRGPDIELAHPPGRRIVVLGDSLTVGWGVEENETFTSRVQAERPAWQVLNLGVSGYGTRSEWLLLQRTGPSLRPDDVVLAFYPNDPPESSHVLPFPPEQPKDPWGWRALYLVQLESYLQNRTKIPYYVTPNPQDWAACLQALIRIKTWCQEHHSRLHLLYIPYKDELSENTLVGYREKVATFCLQEKIDCLDVTPDLRQLVPLEVGYYPLDEHLTPRGHQVIARALLKHL